MYKLIVFDYDGSLVARGRGVDQKIRENLYAWHEAGYKIAIASGRNFRSLKNEFSQLGLDIPLISNNGNLIRMSRTDGLLLKKSMDPELLSQALEIAKNYNLKPIFHIDRYDQGYDLAILDQLDRVSSYYVKYYDNRFKILSEKEIIKEEILSIVLYIDDLMYARILSDLKKFSKDIKTHHLTNGISHGGMMEIVGLEWDKWRAVLEYGARHGIRAQEIIAVGDDMNDLSMVEGAGFGIAMLGSPKQVMDKADYCTKQGAEDYAGIKAVRALLGGENL